MSDEATRVAGVVMPAARITEWERRTRPGVPMLICWIVVQLVGLALVVFGPPLAGGVAGWTLLGIGVALLVVGGFCYRGLAAVAPGQARVVQLFGRYAGTVRRTGLVWMNPFTIRTQISTRVRNHETSDMKVNDADGNPIEIAAVVVWQVEDTARARYQVDDFVDFVNIQTETAVRHIAGGYPYDGSVTEGLSLRDNAEEITEKLSAEITARVEQAGVRIIESRITRLAYAPEIAQAMLRRQQAGAVVAARQQLVDGALGMVDAALSRLAADDLVDLDEERKATMVSNLLVVLCSEQQTQPVINTGTLYQ